MRMRLEGNIARMTHKWKAYGLLMEKSAGKRAHGRPKRRWADDIKVYLVERG
jgi:hypothetical protein